MYAAALSIKKKHLLLMSFPINNFSIVLAVGQVEMPLSF
jgi:hypothetical protein